MSPLLPQQIGASRPWRPSVLPILVDCFGKDLGVDRVETICLRHLNRPGENARWKLKVRGRAWSILYRTPLRRFLLARQRYIKKGRIIIALLELHIQILSTGIYLGAS